LQGLVLLFRGRVIVSRPYLKPFLTVEQQRLLMQSRGLVVADPASLEHALRTIGYYRLSAYTHTFRRREPRPNGGGVKVHDDYLPGTAAEQVLALYEFDRRLKLLVLDAAERIEIAMRFSVAHTLGKRDPFGHLNTDSLDRQFTKSGGGYSRWRTGYDEAQSRAKEAFVEHFRITYDGRLPVWVAVEIMQFGQLSVLFSGLKPEDRFRIAASYGLRDPKVLGSWLHAMTYARNVCAHHSRLWNRNMDLQPRIPAAGDIQLLDHLRLHAPHAQARPYGILCAIKFLMLQIEPEGEWAASARLQLDTLPVEGPVHMHAMGFPPDWRSQPLWHGAAEDRADLT
jgi:abortive infection bacteriophage resistance protein